MTPGEGLWLAGGLQALGLLVSVVDVEHSYSCLSSQSGLAPGTLTVKVVPCEGVFLREKGTESSFDLGIYCVLCTSAF